MTSVTDAVEKLLVITDWQDSTLCCLIHSAAPTPETKQIMQQLLAAVRTDECRAERATWPARIVYEKANHARYRTNPKGRQEARVDA
jgi:hypothetical protein